MTAKSTSRAEEVSGLSVRDVLFILSQDLRTSWDEPEDPVAVEAWRLWHEQRRSETEILSILRAIAASPEPPSLDFDAT